MPDPDLMDPDDFHAAALARGYVPNGAVIPLRLFARWLVSLDLPTMQGARRLATLDLIIEKAGSAVARSDQVRERIAGPGARPEGEGAISALAVLRELVAIDGDGPADARHWRDDWATAIGHAHDVIELAAGPGRDEATPGELMDLLESAWCVIANAGCGATHDGTVGWHNETEDWQRAAERLRDRWHEVLRVWCSNRPEPPRPDPARRPGGDSGEVYEMSPGAWMTVTEDGLGQAKPAGQGGGDPVSVGSDESSGACLLSGDDEWVCVPASTTAPGEVTLDPVRDSGVSDCQIQSDTVVIDRCARVACDAFNRGWSWDVLEDVSRDDWRCVARAVIEEAGRAVPAAGDDSAALGLLRELLPDTEWGNALWYRARALLGRTTDGDG